MSTVPFTKAAGVGADAHAHDHGGHSHSHAANEHGHTHEIMEHPGKFGERDLPNYAHRNWSERAFTVGIGGPVGSGKTALMEALCKRMRDRYEICAITNDIYTKEDARLLTVAGALPEERIMGVETGGCPHTAIREDASINLAAVAEMRRPIRPSAMLAVTRSACASAFWPNTIFSALKFARSTVMS